MVITKVGPDVKAAKKLFPSFDQKNQKTDREVHGEREKALHPIYFMRH